MPMAQLTEFTYIDDFPGMTVRTMNSEFSQRKGIIVRRRLRNMRNSLEFEGALKQEILIPKLDSPGIKSSDSSLGWGFETTSKLI